jgi:hypothetical protein
MGLVHTHTQSWSLPSEVHQWRASCRQRRLEGQRATYIVKPDAGAMGRGIYLVRREEDLDLTNPDFIGWVVQEYVERPLLIDEYKFDLRLYVLVTSVDPLRIYLFDEGLARFATAKYSKPDNKNIATMNMHLTNYSINKKSQDYVSAETDPHKGSKRRLTVSICPPLVIYLSFLSTERTTRVIASPGMHTRDQRERYKLWSHV